MEPSIFLFFNETTEELTNVHLSLGDDVSIGNDRIRFTTLSNDIYEYTNLNYVSIQAIDSLDYIVSLLNILKEKHDIEYCNSFLLFLNKKLFNSFIELPYMNLITEFETKFDIKKRLAKEDLSISGQLPSIDILFYVSYRSLLELKGIEK